MSEILDFSKFPLDSHIQAAIAEMGYVTPTPIQVQAIPVVLAGQDVMGAAQTGTGKTAGYGLPALQRILPKANTSMSPARHPVRVLILAPTRELAVQVNESLVKYASKTPLRVGVVYGGVDIKPQADMLRRGVEVLTATPGRLLDHCRQGNLTLKDIECLVLDEADRMLDMGFWPDIQKLLQLTSDKKQSLLFSATLSDEIHLVAQKLLHKPLLVEINANRGAASIEQLFFKVPECEKPIFLRDLVVDNGLEQVLIFTRQKKTAGELTYHLKKDGFTVEALHGDKTQASRLRAWEAFKNGKLRLLVATVLASRGLEIKELPVVINYELPADSHDYIHRIGRTGRAGAKGLAYSLVGEKELSKLRALESLLKKKLSVTTPERYLSYFDNESDLNSLLRAKKWSGEAKSGKARLKTSARDRVRGRVGKANHPSQKKKTQAEDSFDYILPDFQ